MKLNRSVLLSKIDEAIAEGWRKHSQVLADSAKQREKDFTEWQATKAPQLLLKLKELCMTLELPGHDCIVSREDVLAAIEDQSQRRGYVLTWLHGKDFGVSASPYKPSEDLLSLKAFLEALVDEEVSTSALASAGWRNLRELLS